MKYLKLYEQYETLIHSEKFKQWFGDWEEAYRTGDYSNCSKLVNKDGTPMVVYHATMHEWEKFDMNLATAGSHDMGEGIYFADKLNSSQWVEYAKVEGGLYRDRKMVAMWIAGFKYGSDVAYKNRRNFDWSDYGNIVIPGVPFSPEYLQWAKSVRKIKSTNQDELSPAEIKSLETPYNREEHRHLDLDKFGLVNVARERMKLDKSKLTVKKLYINARNLKLVEDGYIDHTGNFTGKNDSHLYDCKVEGTLDDIRQGVVYNPENAWFFN